VFRAGKSGLVEERLFSFDNSRELERKIILKVLEAQRWNRKRTAEVLSMSYRGLLYKMKEAGL
jgi:DNA-binding NtrC family response regulator